MYFCRELGVGDILDTQPLAYPHDRRARHIHNPGLGTFLRSLQSTTL